MKTKFFLIGLLSLFILSCSSDDQTLTEPKQNPKTTLLDKVTYNGDDYEVSFDGENRVKILNLVDRRYEFFYENNLVSKVISTSETNSFTTIFTHNENGKITSFSNHIRQSEQVSFNDDKNLYSYSNSLLQQKYSLKINNKGDLQDFKVVDVKNQKTYSWGYTFDEIKKGSLWNSNSVSVYIYMIDHNSLDLMLPFSKYPVTSVFNSLGNFNCANQYNKDDYITKTVCAGREVSFHYTEQ